MAGAYGRDMTVGGMLADLLFPGGTALGDTSGPMGRPGKYREDTSVHAVQRAPNGNVRVTFNTMDPSAMGAMARENFRRLGIDSPYVGRKPISIEGKAEGDMLNFEVNGKSMSLNQNALQNARGAELANMLGVQSFMELNQAKANGTGARIKTAPQQESVVLDGKASQAPLPPARPRADEAAPPQNQKVDFQEETPTQNIPQMMQAPMAMMPMQGPMMPPFAAMQQNPALAMLPGYQQMLQQISPVVQQQMPQMKQSKAGLPAIGSDFNPLGPFGGGQ
jgi:hypothetical protein